VDDNAFLGYVADRLGDLTGVRAVTLGGSRAEGRFSIEPLLFHLAGIPSYLVLAELSVKRVLRGELPTPGYPAALRQTARAQWWGRADAALGYARTYHAAQGRLAQCVGLVAQAAAAPGRRDHRRCPARPGRPPRRRRPDPGRLRGSDRESPAARWVPFAAAPAGQ
jgi:hypothetical protein